MMWFALCGHLIYWSRTILCSLVESHQDKIIVKFDRNWLKGCHLKMFVFIGLVAILSIKAKPF